MFKNIKNSKLQRSKIFVGNWSKHKIERCLNAVAVRVRVNNHTIALLNHCGLKELILYYLIAYSNKYLNK